MKRNRNREWLFNLIGGLLVLLIIAAFVALALAGSYVCHRWTGPYFTGSNDPVAVAIYCRPSDSGRR